MIPLYLKITPICLFLILCSVVTVAKALLAGSSVTRLTRTRLSAAENGTLGGERRINLNIALENPKISSMEDLGSGEKKVYCRCWLSGTFPLCDGTHVKHNAAMNDNVGPLIISVPSSEGAKETKRKEVGTKGEGRKKRVLLGYYATSIAYLVCAAPFCKMIGIQSFAGPVASGYALAAGIAYILAAAVNGDRLSSDTYKRLNLSLLWYGLLGDLGFCLGGDAPKFSPLLLASLLATVNGIKGYTYGVLGFNKAGTASILGDFTKGIASTFKNYFAAPKNAKAVVYWGATWMLTIMKVAKFGEIVRLIVDGANGFTVYSRVSRLARYSMMATVLYTLKDAADRGRLEGTTFIGLNVLSSGALAALASYSGIYTAKGGAAAAFSVFTAFNGVTSIVQKRQR